MYSVYHRYEYFGNHFYLQDGFTPLMAAANNGHLSVVELLVSVGGAEVNSQSNVSH